MIDMTTKLNCKYSLVLVRGVDRWFMLMLDIWKISVSSQALHEPSKQFLQIAPTTSPKRPHKTVPNMYPRPHMQHIPNTLGHLSYCKGPCSLLYDACRLVHIAFALVAGVVRNFCKDTKCRAQAQRCTPQRNLTWVHLSRSRNSRFGVALCVASDVQDPSRQNIYPEDLICDILSEET